MPQARDVPALITGKTNESPRVLPLRSVRARAKLARFPGGSAAFDKLAKARPGRGGQSPQAIRERAGCARSLVLAQLAVDGARRDAEQLRGQRFVASGVSERIANHALLDLRQRRADRKRQLDGSRGVALATAPADPVDRAAPSGTARPRARSRSRARARSPAKSSPSACAAPRSVR